MTGKLLFFETKSQRELREGTKRFVAFMLEAHEHNHRLLRERESAKAADPNAKTTERP